MAYFCQDMANGRDDARRREYWARIEDALGARGRKQNWLEGELAKVSGKLSRGKLSNLKKRGARQIDIETAEHIARLLDVDPCWLVLGRGEMGHYTERLPSELERVASAVRRTPTKRQSLRDTDASVPKVESSPVTERPVKSRRSVR